MQAPVHESIPPHEVGILRSLGNGKSQFIGSSSGVYFVNTVRRAFSAANPETRSYTASPQPSPEDCIVGNNDEDESSNPLGLAELRPIVNGEQSSRSYGSSIPEELGKPPSRSLARQLMVEYFRTWHSLFPFLHGPSLVQQVEQFYSTENVGAGKRPTHSHTLARAIIFQCLFNLAALDGSLLPPESRLDRPSSLIGALAMLALRSDLESLQALLAAQLLLLARMCLRESSVVGGLLCRSIYQSGLHRCPVRYPELSDSDCDLRKRIFWSAYVIDRYLSQTLGHPLGIQDSDIDVCCIDGTEIHKVLTDDSSTALLGRDNRPNTTATAQANRRANSVVLPVHRDVAGSPRTDLPLTQSSLTHGPRSEIIEIAEARQISRQLALAYHVKHARLVGRAVELFHKSMHVRSMDPDAVWRLRADVAAWWNNLPASLQDDERATSMPQEKELTSGASKPSGLLLPIFFRILHHQQILLINRPWLSLEPSSPEFSAALQACVCASREIIATLRKEQRLGYITLPWPAHLSAVWMSGLIIAFACQLRTYAMDKGRQEIDACLQILENMVDRWPMAKHCHSVLIHLQNAFKAREKVSITKLAEPIPGLQNELSGNRTENEVRDEEAHRPKKRAKTGADLNDPKHTGQLSGHGAPQDAGNYTTQKARKDHGIHEHEYSNSIEETHSAMAIPATPDASMNFAGMTEHGTSVGLQYAPTYDLNIMTPGVNYGGFDDLLTANWDCGLPDVFGGLHALPFNWDMQTTLNGTFT